MIGKFLGFQRGFHTRVRLRRVQLPAFSTGLVRTMAEESRRHQIATTGTSPYQRIQIFTLWNLLLTSPTQTHALPQSNEPVFMQTRNLTAGLNPVSSKRKAHNWRPQTRNHPLRISRTIVQFLQVTHPARTVKRRTSGTTSEEFHCVFPRRYSKGRLAQRSYWISVRDHQV